MTEEETEPANNMEIIEEDFVVEEISDPMYTIDIKQENDYHSEEVSISDECHKYEFKTAVENSLSDDQKFTYGEQLDNDQMQNIACQSCECTFQTMEEAEYHDCESINSTHSIIVCENCQTVLYNEEQMEKHNCQNFQEEPVTSLFTCPDCPKSFSLITMLQKHQSSHKPRKVLPKDRKGKINETGDDNLTHCSICNTTFSSQKNLKLHSKMHVRTQTKTIQDAMPVGTDPSENQNTFFCEICNKSFNHSLLFVHQNMHQNIEEHNCSICNRQFENQISYDMHMQLHADQPTKIKQQIGTKPGARFACNYCGKVFLRPHEKVKHERIHTGEKPYECEVCGKSFRVSYSLTLHLRTHTDIRPFVCAQCNKRFKSYAVYSHHLNTHSEDRPYKCPMCPKSFRTSVQLCGHKNSHTKPYNCPECNRPFSSLYAVKMHMKTHNKANKSNENLKHRCYTCGAVYARMFALRFHMREQHSLDLPEDEESSINNLGESTVIQKECINDNEVSTHAMLSGEEIVIDNFQPEEIVTDWLTQK